MHAEHALTNVLRMLSMR